MKEYTVKSWSQFDEIVFGDSWNNDIKRYRTNLVFRGISHSNYDLVPSLNRVCGSRLDLEESLIRNFKKYASLDIKDPVNFWEVISLAQHHGLPTRLLDWTFSPYVAAHFATENFEYYDVDCAIWCVDFVECHKYLPAPLKEALDEKKANGFSVDILNSVVGDFKGMFELESKYDPFVLFFEPPSIDNRIINQFALFSVMSDPSKTVSQWLLSHTDLCFKIIIPADIKLEIRDKLDQINMTERILYPGLDGLCKWLARYYTPAETINKRKADQHHT